MADALRDRGLMIVLAYLWPLAFVPLFVSREEPEVQWHAKHGLVLMAAEALALFLLVAVSALGTLASFVIGCVLSVFIAGAVVAILALHTLAIIKGLSGKRLIVPGVSPLADRF